ncbi:MAG: RNA polymerase sigma-70 factor [Bacteroidaceae bacterium]
MADKSDSNSFNYIYTNYKDRFIRFAYTYVKDMPVAEDLVIDALLYYWENRALLKHEENIPAYLLTTVKHKCLNYLKQQQTHRTIEGTIQVHEEWKLATKIATLEACEPYELFTEEAQEIVNKTLEQLPQRTREIFIMSRMQNKSYKEIAAELGLTTKGVEFHITKALKTLRITLKDYLPVFIYLFYN